MDTSGTIAGVVAVLKAATTTNLDASTTRIYAGDWPATGVVDTISVWPATAVWTPIAIGTTDSDDITLHIQLQMRNTDSTSQATHEAEFNRFLDFAEEIKVALLSSTGRRVQDPVSSEYAYKLSAMSWTYGYATEDRQGAKICLFEVTWKVPHV